jgi:undecaprenyldiphospho-muramoylpentapeptide beta-N-acetylglucosaminyltransferase
VYPALVVLQTLGSDANSVLWVGGEDGMEAELVTRLNIPYTTIPAAGVHGVGLLALPSNLWRLLRCVFASRKLLSDFKPDALLFTGGFVAVPMAVAGISTPSLLFTPDIEPGLAIKAIARFSDCVALTAEQSKAFFAFHKRLIVSGYPTRPDLLKWTAADARKHFGLHAKKPVLLVYGGSKGAQSINLAVLENLPDLLVSSQVLHITGQSNYSEAQTVRDGLTANAQDYLLFPYLHEDMGAAFAAADLVVSRAGASTLGELPLFGLPAILVPYPYAWRYQKVNADYLVKHGGALLIKDEDLKSELLPTVTSLLKSPDRLTNMKNKMKALSNPQASQILAATLRELVSETKDRKA